VTPRTAARDRLVVPGYRAAVRLARLVPPELAYPVLDRLADLVRLGAPGARAAIEANLEQVLGGRGRRHAWAVRGVFRHMLWNYYDTFRLPAMTDAEIRERVALHGREHLQRALAGGRGAILFSGHVSSVALAAQALALAERGGIVVVEQVQPPALLDLMLRVRGSHGLTYRTLGPGLFGDLAGTLRRNELVFLVVDRDIGGSGSPVELFGRPVRLPTGPALLHLRTGAPILPTYVSRRQDGRLDGVVGAPLPIRLTGHRRPDVTEISRTIARRLEYHIGKYPEQWTMLQGVWES
jgi:phosphatidylinositol dimannoside acyltransferase